MYFMNTWEIDFAVEKHSAHPVLGPATVFLRDFRNLIDENSDGWCYWTIAVKAAAKLMQLIERTDKPTRDQLRRAITPIKAFCTRHGLSAPVLTSGK